MRIAVIGLGYVGLVTAASLSDTGHHVIGYDADTEKLESLWNAEIPFFEPGLAQLVAKNVDRETLSFSSTLDTAIQDREIIFIAVGTPPGSDGSADLTNIYQVIDSLGQLLDRAVTIVIKSTVPVGTNQAIDHTLNSLLKSRGLLICRQGPNSQLCWPIHVSELLTRSERSLGVRRHPKCYTFDRNSRSIL